MVCFQQVDGCCNSNASCDQTITQFGVEDLVLGLKECENSHTLTTTTTGLKNSQEEANNQTDNQNSVLCPPKDPFFTDSCSRMKSSAKHTLSNNLSQ